MTVTDSDSPNDALKEAGVEQLREIVNRQQHQIKSLTEGLNTVVWLHHELVFGLRLAMAKKAVEQAGPELARKIASGELKLGK